MPLRTYDPLIVTIILRIFITVVMSEDGGGGDDGGDGDDDDGGGDDDDEYTNLYLSSLLPALSIQYISTSEQLYHIALTKLVIPTTDITLEAPVRVEEVPSLLLLRGPISNIQPRLALLLVEQRLCIASPQLLQLIGISEMM